MKPWTLGKWFSWKPTHSSVRWPSEAVGSVFSTASEGHRTVKTRTTNFARGFRHGVTVLEVLFSIGIVAVGLLGVLTIVPVAGNRVTQGSIADNSDRLGRNAIRQFDVGQMRRENMWSRFWTGTTPPPWQNLPVPQNLPPQQYVPFSPTLAEPAFCIDPLFISTRVTNANSAGNTVLQKTEFFPYFVPNVNTEARMRRISLRKLPGASHNFVPPPAINLQMGMPLRQAYQIFMAQDDLVFDLPDDRTLAPQQKFDAANSKRQFDGKYTWMATVSPKDFYYYVPVNQLDASRKMDLCTLSIIVMYRRDMSMAMHYSDPEHEGPDPERLVYADFRWNPTNPSLPPPATSTDLAPGAGIGGGNVWLKTIDRSPARPHVKEDLEVRKGDWLMLSAKVYPLDPIPNDTDSNNVSMEPAPVSAFRWYRVVSTDAALGDATNGFAREVTLLGPDWTDVIGAQMVRGGAPVAQATLLNCVAAVYEKTIRLETTSLWTDL